MEGSHLGGKRRQRLPEGGGGLCLMNVSGLGRCVWKRREAKGRDEGQEVDSGRKEKEQSCSLGQIFCRFIRFSVSQLVFARTGYAGEC